MQKAARKMWAIRRLLRGKFRMKIREKMTLIVLSTSIVTVLALSGIMFYGMIGARNMAIQYSSEIGKQVNENSSDRLAEQKKKELMDLAADKADDIDYRLSTLEKAVRIAATMMQKIHAHPKNYLPQPIVDPPASGAGEITFYVQYAPTVDAETLKSEMELSANIRDTLIGLIECNPVIDSIFVASNRNYILSADNNIKTLPEEYDPPDLNYDTST